MPQTIGLIKRRDSNPKVRYASAMTVCIAAACTHLGKPRIVLCSDTRLDYGDFGSTNRAVKCDVLGHGWVVQMAGNWSSVRAFCSILKDRIQHLKNPIFSNVVRESKGAINQFLKSPLFDPQENNQLLLSGFEDGSARIIEVSILRGKPKIDSKDSCGVIGSGANIAFTLLSLREHHINMPLSYVAYLVYEAKRCSEKTGYVGQFTTLMVQKPNVNDIKDKAYLRIMNSFGREHLETVYAGLRSIPFAKIPDLDPDFFIDLKEKQSPQ